VYSPKLNHRGVAKLVFLARQKRLHQPTTGCCTHEARRKNSTLSVASLTGKRGARHAFGVDDEDDSPFVAGLKAWFMGWVSFSRAHLPKSGSFLMSAEVSFCEILDFSIIAIGQNTPSGNSFPCTNGSPYSCIP
jgi:hypothetical protein